MGEGGYLEDGPYGELDPGTLTSVPLNHEFWPC